MEGRNRLSSYRHGNIIGCFFGIALLVVPQIGNTEAAIILASECDLDGFSLGATAEEMQAALGAPDDVLILMSTGDEYPHPEYRYEGLRIVFSTHGRSALSYFVSADKYQLRSGIGVGSTRTEVESALGSTGRITSGETEYMIYLVRGPDGQSTIAQMTLKLNDDDVVTEFSVFSR